MTDALRDAIDALRADGLHRELRPLLRAGGRALTWRGREYLNFASNNYLGLSDHPKLIEASVRAAESFGVGGTASRLVSGSLELHGRLESAIAELKGTEAALAFPTGYMAAIGCITALASPSRDATRLGIVMDKLNHASLIDGGRLAERMDPPAELRVYPHGNLEKLERLLARWADENRRALVVTDAVFSMDGDIADLPAIGALARTHGADLMVDEAHATGVLGERGRGASEALGCEDSVQIHMGTLSKALGGLGGFIAGSSELIDLLVNRARSFIYTTALPPSATAAAIAAVEIVKSDEGALLRGKLRRNAEMLRGALRAAGHDIGASETQIVPVILGGSERVMRASESLLAAGILAPAIRPPTVPVGTARLRLSVTASHEPEDIERVISALGAPE